MSPAADAPPIDFAALERWLARAFPDVATIDTASLATWLDDASRSPPVLIDVRSGDEQAVGALAGARFAADAEAARACAADVPRDTAIVAYCSVGVRSARAARAIAASGHARALNLAGGLFAWANERRLMVRGTERTRFAHPFDERWAVLLAPELRAWRP
jgi:rhodanese-related sulfurtransferase